MDLIAIDPGTIKVGWAVFQNDRLVAAGTQGLKGSRQESLGMRTLRLRRFLDELRSQAPAARHLAYEEVRRHRGTTAAHSYGAAMAVLQEWAIENELDYFSVPVSDVKQAATGKGGGAGTGKAEVLQAARDAWPHLDFPDDNAADAAWLGALNIRMPSN